jgi:hypothetical protein
MVQEYNNRRNEKKKPKESKTRTRASQEASSKNSDKCIMSSKNKGTHPNYNNEV